MLKQKALIQVLSQVNTNEITGAMLFNKEGLLLAFSGYKDNKAAPNVSAALLATMWDAFDRRNSARSSQVGEVAVADLRESIFVVDEGVVAIMPVSSMLLAVKATSKAELGMVRTKLRALAKYLEGPISMIERE